MSAATGSREDAIHALINVWIKDPELSCGWCGEKFTATEPCCEKPFIASNSQILQQFVKEIASVREQQRNKFASTSDNSLRLAVSMPPSLMLFLEKAFMRLYKEQLFTKEHDVVWFAKHFGKYFAVPKEL